MDIPPEVSVQSPYSDQLRQFFKLLNRLMVFLFRSGFGGMLNASPRLLGRYMVVVHRGRKTGARRTTPVNYLRVGDCVYCTAGFGQTADWYRNLLVTPACELWLPDGAYHALATEVNEDRLTYLRAVLASSGFAASLFGGVEPFSISNEDLDAATRDYRLMRFTLAGQSADYRDLRWVSLALLPAVLFAVWRVIRRRS